MPDVFLSYSFKDSPDALALLQRLRANGLDVWIDQHGLGGASSWSGEIADAIRDSTVYMIILSPNSVGSINVRKELCVAAELRKPLLPIELIPTELTRDFLFHLAGIQRVKIADGDAIRAALRDAGIAVLAESATSLGVQRRDERKSLIILPFQDLSPNKDNEWFAEGLVSELLDALSRVKSLRLVDERTATEFSKAGSKVSDIAHELGVRYFLDGSVRKFGDQIKISVRLLDHETEEYLWSHSFKGEFSDILDIQERVADEVLQGLQVHLTPNERTRVAERSTQFAEAKELFWRADKFFERHTKQSHEFAIEQLEQAIELDPYYAEAHQLLALVYVEYYRLYDRTPTNIESAERVARRALELDPQFWKVYGALSAIFEAKGDIEEAEWAAKLFVEHDPDFWFSHYSLGLLYARTRRPDLAVACYETALMAQPENPMLYWNIALVARRSNNETKLKQWSKAGVQCYARYLRLTPDDNYRRIQYANLLHFAGEDNEAREQLSTITNVHDAFSLYNLACLAANLGDTERALTDLEGAVAAGFADGRLIASDPDLESVRDSARYRAVMERFATAAAA